MKNQFVPYEIAKRLEELGFNEPCFSKWKKDIGKTTYRLYPILVTFYLNGPYEKESNGYDQKQVNEGGYQFTGYKNSVLDHGEQIITAPLWQQVIDWFREEHYIFISLDIRNSVQEDDGYYFKVFKNGNAANSKLINTEGETYYEALTAALTKAFELIS